MPRPAFSVSSRRVDRPIDGGRTTAWLAKPPAVLDTLLQRVQTAQLLLLHQVGPTSFVVRQVARQSSDVEGSVSLVRQQDHQEAASTSWPTSSLPPPSVRGAASAASDPAVDSCTAAVRIGHENSCSCAMSRRHRRKEQHPLCIHLLFVMTKVLQLQQDNPLVWQGSWVDREVDDVLSMQARRRHRIAAERRAFQRQRQQQRNDGGLEQAVERRAIAKEDVCPICMDGLHAGQRLWYCSTGCGNNVHARCLKHWADHQRQRCGSATALKCPLCRQQFDLVEYKAVLYRNSSGATASRVSAGAPRSGHHSNDQATIPPTLAAELQSRDLTSNDYDLLLQLDQHQHAVPTSEARLTRDRGSGSAAVLLAAHALPCFVIDDDYENNNNNDGDDDAPAAAGSPRRDGNGRARARMCIVCNSSLDPGTIAAILPCYHRVHKPDCVAELVTRHGGACPADRVEVTSAPRTRRKRVPLRGVNATQGASVSRGSVSNGDRGVGVTAIVGTAVVAHPRPGPGAAARTTMKRAVSQSRVAERGNRRSATVARTSVPGLCIAGNGLHREQH